MAIIECGNGHVYDPAQYASCPYCIGGNSAINFDNSYARNAPGKTTAPSAYRDSIASNAAWNGGGQPEPQKTVAPEWLRKKSDEQNKTVAIFKKKYDMEPVVGWLACVEGPEKGKGYHLWAKINTIGRSETNDVCVKGDSTISKESHARLAYDPKHNSFQLIPGTSVNNIYLNDEPIYIPARLEAYDLIELGSTKMIFVPLCSDRFQWTNEQEQGE